MEIQYNFLENLLERVDEMLVEIENVSDYDDSTEIILEAAQNLRDEIAAQTD